MGGRINRWSVNINKDSNLVGGFQYLIFFLTFIFIIEGRILHSFFNHFFTLVIVTSTIILSFFVGTLSKYKKKCWQKNVSMLKKNIFINPKWLSCTRFICGLKQYAVLGLSILKWLHTHSLVCCLGSYSCRSNWNKWK